MSFDILSKDFTGGDVIVGAVTKWFHGTTSAYQHQFDHVMAHKSKLQSDFGR